MAYLSSLVGDQSQGTPPSPQGSPALTAPAPAPQESPAAGAAPDPKTITPEQLSQVPPVAAVLTGTPAGFWVDEKDTHVIEPLVQSIPKLAQLGLSAYRTQAKQVVVYNPKSLAPAALQKLDQEDKVSSTLPPLRDLAVASQKQAAPGQAPAAPASPQPAMAAPMPGAPAAPRAQAKIAGTRLQALMPQDPTSGAAPGQGRILNGLLQRTV